MLESVDDRNNLRALLETTLLLRGYKRPELVDIDSRAPLEIGGKVEAAHTNLTEVTRVVLIEVGPIGIDSRVAARTFFGYRSSRKGGRGTLVRFSVIEQNRLRNAPVVVLTTSETATSGVLAVLAYTTVTGGDVSSVLASLGQMSRHLSQKSKKGKEVSIRNSILQNIASHIDKPSLSP